MEFFERKGIFVLPPAEIKKDDFSENKNVFFGRQATFLNSARKICRLAYCSRPRIVDKAKGALQREWSLIIDDDVIKMFV